MNRTKRNKRINWAEQYLICEKQLNERFLGQQEACEALASIMAQQSIRCRQELENPAPRVLLQGAVSTGKSSMAIMAAEKLQLPYTIVNCGALTPNGYKGTGIEDAVENLILAAGVGGQERAEAGSVLIIDKLLLRDVEDFFIESILYSLLPILGGEKLLIASEGDWSSSGTIFNLHNTLVIMCGVFDGVPQVKWKNNKDGIKALLDFGLPTELVSRITHIINLNKVKKEDLYKVVEREALTIAKNYQSGSEEPSLSKAQIKRIGNEVYSHPLGIRHARMLIHKHMDQQSRSSAVDDMFM